MFGTRKNTDRQDAQDERGIDVYLLILSILSIRVLSCTAGASSTRYEALGNPWNPWFPEIFSKEQEIT